MKRSSCGRFLLMTVTALALLLTAGGAQAATKTILMDAFKPVFQFTPGEQVARYYPSAIGGRTPLVTPVRNYSACTVLSFPAKTKISSITYTTSGNSGWTTAFLDEFHYEGVTSLVNDYFNGYSVATQSPGEHTLFAAAPDPLLIRGGYRYELCVEGAPGTATSDYNQFHGFRIRYKTP